MSDRMLGSLPICEFIDATMECGWNFKIHKIIHSEGQVAEIAVRMLMTVVVSLPWTFLRRILILQ